MLFIELLHKRISSMFINRSKPDNPFFLNPDMPDKYFCGRQRETQDLVQEIKQKNSRTVILGPRRLGKTALLHHVAAQPEIKRHFNFIYVDLMKTATMEDFISELNTAVEKADVLNHLKREVGEINRQFHANVKLLLGPAELEVGGERSGYLTQVKKATEDIFDKLAKTSCPNFIVFDEFQKVSEYEGNEKGPFTGFLRSKIQFMPKCSFVFCGSDQHMLHSMFFNENEPFYKSSEMYPVSEIPKEEYRQFCSKILKDYKMEISDEACDMVYDLMLANTKDMQSTMHHVFKGLSEGDKLNKEKMKEIINGILDRNDTLYRTQYRMLVQSDPLKAKVLHCIAKEGAVDPLDAEMIRKYGFKDQEEEVQNILKSWTASKVTDEPDEIEKAKEKTILKSTSPGVYIINDRRFDLWMAKQIGTLQDRFKNPENTLKKIRNYENRILPQKDNRFKKTFGLK